MENKIIKRSNNHVNGYKMIFLIHMKVIEAHHFAILPQIMQVISIFWIS